MFFQLIVLCTLVFGCSQGAIIESRPLTRLDLQTFGFNGRIIQGQPARPGQFPWQVAVNFVQNGGSYFCGGTLISPDWVLTAGHCVYQSSSFSIRLGTLKSSGSGEASLQVIPGERGINHPQYNPSTLNNDVGLIKLAQKAQLNEYVKVIPLANSNDRLDANIGVTVSGWGMTRTGGSVSPDLNYVNLSTISNEQCKQYYAPQYIIDSTVCCKGTSIQSTCNGDSGGPLVRYTNNGAVHVGIVSFISSLGCESGYPSGYVRTASFREWIRQNTGV